MNTNPDAIWMPNDFYGHIHDEFWERLVAEDSTTNHADSEQPVAEDVATNLTDTDAQNVDPAAAKITTAVRQIGTNGLPRLIELMSAKPTTWARWKGAMTEKLPSRLGDFIFPYEDRTDVERQHLAAGDGLAILGTNAEPALPALSNLLFRYQEFYESDPMQLACTIACIGPKGMTLLTNALASTNSGVRESAALALGFEYQHGRPAVPALLNCVEHGYASYQVLGALGRIGCDDPRLTAALVRLLQNRGTQAVVSLNGDMAFLLLGLHHKQARPAAPLVIAEYRLLEGDTNAAAYRRFYRRILRAIAPDLETQLPPRPPDEDSNNWP